jgi:hypothetical protein
MKTFKTIEDARFYAKNQSFDCFILKNSRQQIYVRPAHDFKGARPFNVLEFVRYSSNKTILSGSEDGGLKPTSKRRKAKKQSKQRATDQHLG